MSSVELARAVESSVDQAERQALAAKAAVLTEVETLVDSSTRVVADELTRLGIDPSQITQVLVKLRVECRAKWAEIALYWCPASDSWDLPVIEAEDVAAFLLRKFGVMHPVPERHQLVWLQAQDGK